MNTNNRNGGTRFAWLGFAAGLLCMSALFIAGAVKGNAGMMVMAASTATLLGAVWVSVSASLKKKASKEQC